MREASAVQLMSKIISILIDRSLSEQETTDLKARLATAYDYAPEVYDDVLRGDEVVFAICYEVAREISTLVLSEEDFRSLWYEYLVRHIKHVNATEGYYDYRKRRPAANDEDGAERAKRANYIELAREESRQLVKSGSKYFLSSFVDEATECGHVYDELEVRRKLARELMEQAEADGCSSGDLSTLLGFSPIELFIEACSEVWSDAQFDLIRDLTRQAFDCASDFGWDLGLNSTVRIREMIGEDTYTSQNQLSAGFPLRKPRSVAKSPIIAKRNVVASAPSIPRASWKLDGPDLGGTEHECYCEFCGYSARISGYGGWVGFFGRSMTFECQTCGVLFDSHGLADGYKVGDHYFGGTIEDPNYGTPFGVHIACGGAGSEWRHKKCPGCGRRMTVRGTGEYSD